MAIRTEMLEKEAKQSWSSGKVILQIGYTEVATIHHSGGNGLSEEDAVCIAKQMANGWNLIAKQRADISHSAKFSENAA